MLPYFEPFEGDEFEPESPIPALQQLDWYQIYTRAGNRSVESELSRLDSAILVQDFDLPSNDIHADLLGWAIANSGDVRKIRGTVYRPSRDVFTVTTSV